MRTPRILDAVEDLIGSDLLCWNTLFWVKEAGSESFVSWHQDYNYWGLDSRDLVTVWLALSPASVESGCMKVMPGSHKKGSMPHADKYNDDNMLTRGQEISKGVDEDKAVFMPLEPGQASFHNVQTAHASGANNTSERRIGLSLHYLPTHAQQTVGDWDSAALVRGEDKYGNFTPAPRPKQDMDPDAVAFHERASGAVRDILFTGADKVRYTL
jgi:ectoine hydroxylase-related dioxygenase (phytanoyl-CoA dioxygenase family)